MGKLTGLVEALREVRAQRTRIADLERELLRVSPQVAALEERVELLTRRLADERLAAADLPPTPRPRRRAPCWRRSAASTPASAPGSPRRRCSRSGCGSWRTGSASTPRPGSPREG